MEGERAMSIELSLEQKDYMLQNDMSVSENSGEYTLHYDNYSYRGLSDKEVKYIIDQYISAKYCSYRPREIKYVASITRDD